MSLNTVMQNFRFTRKVEQEKTNAAQTVSKARNTTITRMMGIPAFALAFVFALMGLTQPASATSFNINETVGPILQGVAALVPDIVSLIIAIVPAIIVLAVVGFILKFLDQILAALHFK